MFQLDKNADYVSMEELAQALYNTRKDYTQEHSYNEGNPQWQLYLSGIINSLTSVLGSIGFIEPEEEN